MAGIPLEDDWLPYDLGREQRRARMRRVQVLAAVAAISFSLGRWGGDSGPSGGGQAWAAAIHAAATAEQEDLSDELVGPCEALRVVDGDTVDVRCEGHVERIRMLRIDTPERGQPGHRAAAETLAEMIDGEDVYLGFEERGRPTRGHYGRLLAYLHADGRNLNVEMVREGWSPFWTKYGTGRLSHAFSEAELEARFSSRGLWSQRARTAW